MNKFLFGVFSLVVPMALVAYNCNVINAYLVAALGCLAIIFMLGYTIKKFSMIGKRRGYNCNWDAFGYAAIGNAVTAFVFLFLTFVGARIYSEGFWENSLRFAPLMASVAYFSLIGIIACVIYLIRNSWINGWQRTLMLSIIGFVACIGFSCAYEALKPYGAVVPENIGNFVSAFLMLSALGSSICGYKLTVYDVEHC